MSISAEIWISHEYVTVPCNLRVSINNIVKFDGYAQDRILFEFDTLPTDYCLTICVYNRNESTATQVDLNGNIIKNTYVGIDNIILDNIMMRNLLQTQGDIQVDWLQNPMALDYIIKQGHDPTNWCNNSTCLALNCSYNFKFQYPIDQWVMSKKDQIYTGYVFKNLMGSDNNLLTRLKNKLK